MGGGFRSVVNLRYEFFLCFEPPPVRFGAEGLQGLILYRCPSRAGENISIRPFLYDDSGANKQRTLGSGGPTRSGGG